MQRWHRVGRVLGRWETAICRLLRLPLAEKTLFEQFEDWYESSLINRVAVKAQLLIMALVVLIGTITYGVVQGMVTQAVEDRLLAVAKLNEQRLQSALDRIMTETEALSRRSLVVTGIVDSGGGQAYLRPYLAEYRQGFPELFEISVFDGRGTIVASSAAQPHVRLGLLDNVLAQDRLHYFLQPDPGEPRLHLAYPIRYAATGTTEGVLEAELDLYLLAERAIRTDELRDSLPVVVSLADARGNVLYRSAREPSGKLIKVSLPLPGRTADMGIGIVMTVSTPAQVAVTPLVRLGLAIALVGFVMVVIAALLTRRMSETIIQPLADMSGRAMEIAQAGPLGLRQLEEVRRDEVGQMGRAFNEMVHSLRQAYDSQEEQVRRRTTELAEARERLAGVLAGMDDVVYSAAADFSRIEYVSPASVTVFGHLPEAFYAQPGLLQSLVYGEDVGSVEAARQALSIGHDMEVRYRIVRPDGKLRWVLDRSHLVLDAEGTVVRISGILRDVTSEVEAEALLQLRDRALASSSCGVVISDMRQPGQPILYVNAAFERITGYTAEEVLGRNCAILQGDHTDHSAIDEIRAALREGRECKVELRNYRKNGRPFWNELMLSPLRDAQGNVTHFIGIQNDVTDRFESSDQIIALMRQLDAIFTLSPDGFAYFDETGLLSFVNPAFERMTGIQAGQISGVTMQGFEERLRALADPVQPFPDLSGDDLLSEVDGKLLYLEQPERKALLVSRRGGEEGGVVYLRDVTRETEVDRMKSEFLSTAAHELRTPMASIMGFAELLTMREFPPERVKDMLGTIHRQAKRLTDLINELLDLARIEARAGKDFKLVRQSPLPIVRDAVAALHIEGGRERMQLDLPESLPEIEIDSAKLQQAILNVLSNAYKYSPQGGAIEIAVRQQGEGPHARIGIAVRDHGLGMTPEQVGRVFERFFRADPSGNIPGTGLGMSLVKEILEQHGGGVQVDSTFGDGTEVTLWLPLQRVPKQPQGDASAGKAADPGRPQGEATLWLDEKIAA